MKKLLKIQRFVRWIAAVGSVALVVAIAFEIFQPISSQQNASYNCGGSVVTLNSVQASGFLMNGSSVGPPAYETQYVLKPNSTGLLKIEYYAPSMRAEDIYANQSYYFKPIDSWFKLGTNTSAENFFLSDAQAGISASPMNMTVTGNHTLTETYEINSSSYALKGAYILDVTGTCGPALILTIGNSVYIGPGLSGGKYN
jgi:hypothetical protein